MKIFMKEGDQIYLNGAKFQVDRKVSIELLNKSKFLLDNHMLRVEDVDNPLKELYFAVQLMITNTVAPDEARQLFNYTAQSILRANSGPEMVKLLRNVEEKLGREREYQALKLIRASMQKSAA